MLLEKTVELVKDSGLAKLSRVSWLCVHLAVLQALQVQ